MDKIKVLATTQIVFGVFGTLLYSLLLFIYVTFGAHSASYLMGTGVPFLWGKKGREVILTSHLHVIPILRMGGAVIFTQPYVFMM
jgi:hypothetical protein